MPGASDIIHLVEGMDYEELCELNAQKDVVLELIQRKMRENERVQNSLARHLNDPGFIEAVAQILAERDAS